MSPELWSVQPVILVITPAMRFYGTRSSGSFSGAIIVDRSLAKSMALPLNSATLYFVALTFISKRTVPESADE